MPAGSLRAFSGNGDGVGDRARAAPSAAPAADRQRHRAGQAGFFRRLYSAEPLMPDEPINRVLEVGLDAQEMTFDSYDFP
jgi:hypothetical protein